LKQIYDPNIGNKHEEFIWQTIGGKLWELLTEVILIGCYIALGVIICYKQRTSRTRGTSEEVLGTLQVVESLYKRLILTPFVFFFCYIFGTIRSYVLLRYDDGMMNHTWSNLLSFLHGFGNMAPGFFNFVIFVLLHEQMRKELREDIAKKFRRLITFSTFRKRDLMGGSTSALYGPSRANKKESYRHESGFVSSTSYKQNGGYDRQLSGSMTSADDQWNSGESDIVPDPSPTGGPGAEEEPFDYDMHDSLDEMSDTEYNSSYLSAGNQA